MADKTQQVMWTALPNGLNAAHDAYRVSVLVSPRLTRTANVPQSLDQFQDFTNWPDTLANAKIDFTYGNVSIATATTVSVPNRETWAAVFPPTTPVRSNKFEDRRDNTVLSYPIATVHDFVHDTYADLVRDVDDALPLHSTWFRRLRTLIEPLGSPDAVLRWLRNKQATGDRSPVEPRRAFELLQAYHRPLSREEDVKFVPADPASGRENTHWRSHKLVDLPQPEDFKDRVDFHQIVSSANQYDDLLRQLGLVLDFEIPIDALPAGPLTDWLRVVPKWRHGPQAATGVETLKDSCPGTSTLVERRQRCEAVLRDPTVPVRDGFLLLANHFRLVQVDVDGAGLKTKNFARSVATMKGAAQNEPEPRAGAPALRSAGFMLVDDDRGQKLKDALARAGDLHDADSGGQPVELYREDLLRGYHVDIMDYSVSAPWQSLCRRDGTIDLLNTVDDIPINDKEGMVRLGATQAADGSNPDVLKLYEGLFAWTGWSLTAPAPGNAISTQQDAQGGDMVGPSANTAPDGLPFEANFTARPRSLPSLRYGRRYSMRVRTVDLAHNAVPLATKSDPKTVPSAPEIYRRYEPVEPPALALVRGPNGLEGPADGEAMARIAIRSFNETGVDNTVPTKAVARRHVVPPRTSVKQAETHGKIDKNDRLDPASYGLLASRDAPLHHVMLSMDGVKTKYSAEDEALALPYLPDPFADQVAARFIGPATLSVTTLPPIPYYPSAADSWPDALPFKIVIREKAGASPTFRKATRTLEVPLAKADMVTLRLSHILPKHGLDQMGVWQWFLDRHASEAAAVQIAMDRSKRGLNWLLTPGLDVELVHAVQKPLVKPAFAELSVGRSLRQTHATPLVVTPVDSRSTNKLDLFGRWNEPDDRAAAPQNLYRRSHGIERKLDYLEAPGVSPPGVTYFRGLNHEFGDTRYRRVLYRLEATSRFREFMPPDIRNAPSDQETNSRIKVVSDERVAWVPNSAPPPAPEILYVIPTFGWTRQSTPGALRSWRDGGGLRVYLNRPWFVSGFNEMLGVVLPPDNATKEQLGQILKPFVTQWGTDPIWNAATIDTPAPSHFPLSVVAGPLDPARLPAFAPPEEADLPAGPFAHLKDLQNPSLPPDSPVRLDVAPHPVQYDSERGLWYCDIVVDPGAAYFPFIRLALARYHPVSVLGAHLSPVVTTEFVQLTPERLAVVSPQARTVTVGLYGHAYQRGPVGRRQQPVVEVEVQRFDETIGGDFGWQAIAGVKVRQGGGGRAPGGRPRKRPAARSARQLQALRARAESLLAQRNFAAILADADILALLQPPPIWQGTMTMPSVDKSTRLRLMIKEYERHTVDTDHVDIIRGQADPRLRLVYAEAIEL